VRGRRGAWTRCSNRRLECPVPLGNWLHRAQGVCSMQSCSTKGKGGAVRSIAGPAGDVAASVAGASRTVHCYHQSFPPSTHPMCVCSASDLRLPCVRRPACVCCLLCAPARMRARAEDEELLWRGSPHRKQSRPITIRCLPLACAFCGWLDVCMVVCVCLCAQDDEPEEGELTLEAIHGTGQAMPFGQVRGAGS